MNRACMRQPINRARYGARANTPLVPHLAVIVAILVIWASAVGCTIRLAPDFDPSIVEGLNRANQEALVLFASVSSGAPKESFAVREVSYNKVIGAYDSVRLQVLARPVPRSDLPAPTQGVIERIIENIKRLADRHRDSGLTPPVVQGFKQSYEISAVQALTYEKALQR